MKKFNYIVQSKTNYMLDKIKILQEFEERDWVTKSKEKIKIKNLTLNHLENIVKNLKKKFKSIEDPLNDYPSFQGEMAQIYAEQQWIASNEYYRQLERTLELFECYFKIKNL